MALCQAGSSGPPRLLSCRYAIAYIGFIGFLFIYAMRFNLSMAIVCMVDNTTADNLTVATFDWSRELQGHILSSFFYGYLLTQIPAGFLADRYGGKEVFFSGMTLSAISTVLIPLVAETHFALVIVLRFLIGLGTGVVFPCMHAIWAKWAPLFERTRLIAFTYSGTLLGSVSAFVISGLLCESLGWPSIFYMTGGFCLLWCVSWLLGVYNSPTDHPWIEREEVHYIQEYLSKEKNQDGDAIPWVKILKSLPMWSICAAHVANGWIGYTLFVCMPMYMSDILHFNIKANGLYSALPYIISFVTLNLSSYTADVVRSIGVRTVVVRKAATGLACLITLVTNVAIGFLSADQATVALVLLTICAIGTSLTRSGYVVNHVDIAPRYAGLLYGISNTFATITGILTPIVVGQLTPGKTREEWQIVFIICAVISLVGNLFFVVFAEGEEQEWAKTKMIDIPELEPVNNAR